MEREWTFRAATSADWQAIETLLTAAWLPLEGAREHLGNFVVAERGSEVVCVGGFEQYGSVALLRSMAVDDSLRGRGVGEQLLDAVRANARARGVSDLYLLTTTAARFFGKRGFSVIARGDAPVALQASREFQGACPASATAMFASL